MKTMRKRNRILLLVILLLFIGVGYAFVYTDLRISGIAHITNQNWEVYFNNLQVTSGSVTPITAAKINTYDSTKISFNVYLKNPGEFYEFTVDAVNNGSVDAVVTNVSSKLNDAEITSEHNFPDYIRYTVTYADGTPIQLNDILVKKSGNTATRQKYKVRIEFRNDIDNVDLTGINEVTANLKFEVTYTQASKEASDSVVSTFIQVGDYFTLAPDAEYATTSTAGFSGSTPTADQTLWRVIKVNTNGTVEAVSEYVSTNDISISGIQGYKNYVAGLQDIASCYAKSGYTVATRMMGYDGQTATISNTSSFDATSNNAPSTTSTPDPTTGTGVEYSGGALGDTLYLKDYQMVGNVYQSDTATYGSTGLGTTRKSGEAATYWLASRKYAYGRDDHYNFFGRGVYGGGTLTASILRRYNSAWYEFNPGNAVRPIITLSSEVTKAGGAGTKANPYTFN